MYSGILSCSPDPTINSEIANVFGQLGDINDRLFAKTESQKFRQTIARRNIDTAI